MRVLALSRWLLVLALLGIGGPQGCASASDTPRWGTDFRDGPTSSVTVRVENRSIEEVALFAYSGGSRIRLGSVNGMANSTVRIPWSGFGPLSILLARSGSASGAYETDVLDVGEGEIVYLRIESPLEASDFYK
jgi:hypothetical protein